MAARSGSCIKAVVAPHSNWSWHGERDKEQSMRRRRLKKTDQAPARTAAAKPDARRTIAQTRRGQERGGQGLCAADRPHADERSAGHIRNIPLRTGPEQIAAGPAARRRLFAALQYQE